VSNPDEPKKKPPQPTVAWNPEDLPFSEGEASPEDGATEEPESAPAPPAGDRGTRQSQPTLAISPEEMAVMEEVHGDHSHDQSDDEDPLVGQLLRGKWRVLKVLGAGSFGTVYKVKDEAGGWIEALKILAVDRISGSEAQVAKQRFLREAQIMKRLGTASAHIVGLSTYEEDLEAGMVYFLMEHVDGKSLADVVEEEGPMEVDRAVRLALQGCDALIAAHEGPDAVVHRDLKLENLMLTVDRGGEEMVKVLDFGIAKLAEGEKAETRLTTVGTLGTPGYAAPEQLRAEEVDGRTDLFAYGVILYSLLTGIDPWLGNPATVPTDQIYELMVATERAEVIPFSDAGVDVPPAMQNVVLKLLQRDAADRYQSARELRDALRRVEAGADTVDSGSLRVLTEKAGIVVQVRTGRRTVAEGPTPVVANGLEAGTYKVFVKDERYEPVETSITLMAGAMEDLQVVATPRETGVAATVRRKTGVMAAAGIVIIAGGAAAFLQPWGRTMDLDELKGRAEAGTVSSAFLTEAGIQGNLSLGPIPLPYQVPLDGSDRAEVVRDLEGAGLDVNTSYEVARLVGLAAGAQSDSRYFGTEGSDVRSYAELVSALDPENSEARSLFLKVAERMAWEAEAALEDGSSARAQELVAECLALVPEHPRCSAAGG
jgi:serine/threonine protein kinase